jgi:type IV secretion system protein VirB9
MQNKTSPRRKTFVAACVLALCTASFSTLALAETTPKAGRPDSRVRHVTYVDGQVYRINTRLKTATLIELDKGEFITTVPVGDSKSFLIEEIASKNALMIKPLLRGARTNAVIETNRRFYFLELYESGTAQPYYSVRFKVPDSPKKTRNTVPSGVAPHRYQIEATKRRVAFKPIAVWDDGRKTHFSFGPDAPIPAVFRADNKGREYTVNSGINGTTVIVPRRSERWVLRHGDEFICITADTGEAKP